MPKDRTSPVRLRLDVYDRVQAAVANVIQLGWATLGIESKSTPTLTAVITEAIGLLEERINKAKKGRR